MKRRTFILNLLGLIVFQLCWAEQPPAERFALANAAYENDRFDQAAERYQALIEEGFESASLHYNLANARFYLNQMGPAILNYEKALRLDPSNDQIEHNLGIARAKVADNPEAIKGLAFVESVKRFYRQQRSSLWAIASLIAIWLALLAGLGFLKSQRSGRRRWAFFGGWTLVVFSLVFMGLSLHKRSIEKEAKAAIVMVPSISLRDAPNGVGEVLSLREGIKVSLKDQLKDWYRVELSNSSGNEIQGWLPASALEEI